MAQDDTKERRLVVQRPLSLGQTLGPLRHGTADPCTRWDGTVFWRATRTPEGPASMMVERVDQEVRARAWGEGADWVLDGLPELIGEHHDFDLADIHGDHPVIGPLHARFVGMRIPRTRAVMEAVLPAVLEQRVTGMEAKASYARIVRALGEPAPGPRGTANLMLPPSPDRLAETPSWWFHRFGVERKRATAVITAARVARRLEEAIDFEPVAARRRLAAVPGIGAWTAAEVALAALGDQDAVIVGDFHAANWVAWALAGEARGDDRRMLELLEPFRGARGRVVRMIFSGHPAPPKFGPRYSPLPIAQF